MPAAKSLKVLVVDDQQTMRGLVFGGVSGEVAFDAEGDRADARYSVSHMRPTCTDVHGRCPDDVGPDKEW